MKKVVACVALAALIGVQPLGAAQTEPIHLPDGSTAVISPGGVAQVWSPDHRTVMYRKLTPPLLGSARIGAPAGLPTRQEILEQIRRAAPRAYAADEILVSFRPGAGPASDTLDVPAQTLAAMRQTQSAPRYTNDAQTNRTLAKLGVDRTRRFAPNAYRVHMTASSVRDAVAALQKVASVKYASPNWFVATMRASAVPISRGEAARAANAARAFHFSARRPLRVADQHIVPANYAVTASASSQLNAPAVNAIGAFDEIARKFHQLPGQGEIVTNVSLGDLTDISILGSTPSPGPSATRGGRAGTFRGGGGGGGRSDPCAGIVAYNGPTTVMRAGQRYLDWPSMPLIPTYVADSSGNLSGSAEVCNSPDSLLGEVGLDFSVMAPLPHDVQRPDAQGTGFTDLLGIAPGASYRLVVPGNPATTIADIDAALLAAATQNPRPNVITASIGFGFDSFGFPGRYLEEDPLSNAIIASIVSQYNIVVCVAANDGLRLFTNAAVAPSGGSAATNLEKAGGAPTDLNDLAFSTAPSSVFDSGSIDAGGTTLNDIFAAPPQDPQNHALAAQQAFPVTRYTGETTFSSGYGLRVNVSAPADNIPAMQHSFGGPANAVDVFLEGGTSASAPETAAAAAVALQVARLTGHPFQDARSVRAFLTQTGAQVPNVPQSNELLHVGPQIDLTSEVETLLQRAGNAVASSVARVAVAQRRPLGLFGGVFVSDTDPGSVDLQGPNDQNGVPTGNNQLAWLTIAPDWEGLSPGASFTLHVADARGNTAAIAQGRWARVLPSTILRAAGLPINSSANRTVTLTYEAKDRGHTVSAPLTLTFGPSDGSSANAAAPSVSGTVRGERIAVNYDLTKVRSVTRPLVVVSAPGRVNPATGFLFRAQYIAPLPNLKGTVYVPVRELAGDGVYGVALGLRNDPNGGVDVSDFAYTHVLRAAHDAHANAPLLSKDSTAPGHSIEIPYHGSFTVSWDVSNISGANGAGLEISAPSPTGFFNYNPVNNPGGTQRDNNGVDSGSVYYSTVSGARGSVTLKADSVGLVPTMNHVVRVIPLSGNEPAGEASGVSTVAYDGVLPADGGILENGYGINTTGDDGYLTSAHVSNGVYGASVETFKQSTGAVAVTASSATDSYGTSGSSVYGGDIAIVRDENLFVPSHPTSATTYRLMTPVISNALGALWQPPALNDGVSQLVQTAPNPGDGSILALSGDPIGSSPGIPYQVFMSDLATNTFGPAYNVDAALPVAGSFVSSLAEDTSTKTGYVGFANFATACGPPAFAAVDLATGKIGVFNGAGQGFPLDLAIDSVSHVAAYQTECDLNVHVMDLKTQTAVSALSPAGTGLYNAVDPLNQLIAAEGVGSSTDGGNNNQMSSVEIYDEHGRFVKELTRFNFYNIGLTLNASNLQLNPKTRTGFMFGPLAAQLEPFKY